MLSQGIEYGFTVRPENRLSLSLGYLPKLRIDYGSLGVTDNPAYSAELRYAMGRGAIRLRGTTTQGYWLGDLGVTIR